MTDTTTSTYHDRTVAALEDFIHQRPNLEPGNYISDWSDDEGRKAYRSEARRITRDLNDARLLLRQVTWRDFTKAEWDNAFTAYSGRLSWDGTTLDYCAGQYWPTEYRASVCAVLAQLLRSDYRRNTTSAAACSGPTISQFVAIRSHFRRVFGRGLANRWFN
jgi:hypothetical protein